MEYSETPVFDRKTPVFDPKTGFFDPFLVIFIGFVSFVICFVFCKIPFCHDKFRIFVKYKIYHHPYFEKVQNLEKSVYRRALILMLLQIKKVIFLQ